MKKLQITPINSYDKAEKAGSVSGFSGRGGPKVPAKTTVTVEEIQAAMEANGLVHDRGGWFNEIVLDWDREYSYTSLRVKNAACILGQTAINLAADGDTIVAALNSYRVTEAHMKKAGLGKYLDYIDSDGYEYLGDLLMALNDGTDISYRRLVNLAKIVLDGRGKNTHEIADFAHVYLPKGKNRPLLIERVAE